MQQLPTIRLAVPTRVAAPFDHPDWIFELKMDGFRALAHVADGRCSLNSRKNNAYKSLLWSAARSPAGLFQSIRDIVNEVIARE